MPDIDKEGRTLLILLVVVLVAVGGFFGGYLLTDLLSGKGPRRRWMELTRYEWAVLRGREKEYWIAFYTYTKEPHMVKWVEENE